MNIVGGKTLFNHFILQACISSQFTKERTKKQKRNYIVILGNLCNAIEKMSDKITCHRLLKTAAVVLANYLYLVAK